MMRQIIEIDEELCDGCGQCVPSCAEGALAIVDGKARLVGDIYCDGLGACLGECPQGALTLIEREAPAFDEEAAMELVARQKASALPAHKAGGCPSAQAMSMSPCPESIQEPVRTREQGSRLANWPIQIRLAPPTAPFLKNARLLVAADCVPPALPGFQDKFLDGRALLIGCPKFDDPADYVRRFTELFAANDIQDVTVLEMEVPCCSAMTHIVVQAMQAAGRSAPVERVVIGRHGRVLGRETVAGRPALLHEMPAGR